jgi:hypothetical protein
MGTAEALHNSSPCLFLTQTRIVIDGGLRSVFDLQDPCVAVSRLHVGIKAREKLGGDSRTV